MARARGANALMALAFESTPGTPAGSGYVRMPFVSSNLGEEQGLLASDLIGYGREPLAPVLDVANDDGDVVVPVDLRGFGHWLKLGFGAPVTAPSTKAYGEIAFGQNPSPNSTITINGTTWTFVSGTPTGNQTQIGATGAATLSALITNLNASAVPAIAAATYAQGSTGWVLTITHDTPGPAGNAFTLAASATSRGTPSGPTLLGGGNSHTFTSGAQTLPSATVEIGLPDVPSYGQNFGTRLNSMRLQAARSGLLNATLNLIARGETPLTSSAAGTPSELVLERFAQFSGEIKRNGSALAGIESADFMYANNLERVETLRGDGRIEDTDPGVLSVSGELVARFADTVMLDQAVAGQTCDISYGWTIGLGRTLLITIHQVHLPKPKRPVEGAGGVRARFAWQGAKNPAGKSVTVVLTNDVASYA